MKIRPRGWGRRGGEEDAFVLSRFSFLYFSVVLTRDIYINFSLPGYPRIDLLAGEQGHLGASRRGVKGPSS